MTRYPNNKTGYVYRCTECGCQLADFQGAFWLVRERQRGEGTIEVPYCLECGAESLTTEQD